MLLLSADTSGKRGTIALAQCGAGEECEILEIVPLSGGTFSAQLVPQISAVLDKHGFGKKDIGALAVVSGPGSFTGLRVGLAAIKALAEVLRLPITSISLLAAVAAESRFNGKVLAALDAGRNQFYAGKFQRDPSVLAGYPLEDPQEEVLLTREEFLTTAVGIPVVTPDPVVAGAAHGVGLQVEEIERPHSGVIARLGWKKILDGRVLLPEELEANYLRRSDAEIFAKPVI